MKLSEFYIEAGLLAIIIVLLQWHGISFWYVAVGASGVLFSITVEAAALYLWVNRIAWLVAVLCSFVVIIGPLYDVAYPVIQKIQQNTNNTKIASSYELESKINAQFAKKDTTKNLTRLRNAEKAREDLHDSMEKYRKHISVSSSASWILYIQVIIQAFGLILVQWVQIIIMRRILPLAKDKVPERNPVSNIAKIIKAVANGDFIDDPKIENIQRTLDVTKDEVRQAFTWLVDNGYMTIGNKQYKLVKTGKIDDTQIVISPPV